MLAFPELLVEPAKKAGMSVPENANDFNLYKNKHTHFWIFCQLQLGAPMPSPSVHFDNAQVIADIELEKLKTMSYDDFINAGFQIGYSK